MFTVTKTIDFCYGHRLLKYEGRCRHLHGHNGRIEVDIDSGDLDGRGMVTDFSEIKRILKTWIDETLDHQMILCKDDPLVPVLKQKGELFYVVDDNPPPRTSPSSYLSMPVPKACRSQRCDSGKRRLPAPAIGIR